jgi:hypothetical protein
VDLHPHPGRRPLDVQLHLEDVTLGHVNGKPRGNGEIDLDFWVDNPTAAHDLVMSLGATVSEEAEDRDLPDTVQVDADPARYPFCLGCAKVRELKGGAAERFGWLRSEDAHALYTRGGHRCPLSG